MTRTQALRMAKANKARKEDQRDRLLMEEWRRDHPEWAEMNNLMETTIFRTSIPEGSFKTLFQTDRQE